MPWLIPLIGLPTLILIAGAFLWLSMQRNENAKQERRLLRNQKYEQLDKFKSELVSELDEATKRIVQKNPGAVFRGFAICLDDDISSYYLAAESRKVSTKKRAAFRNSEGHLVELPNGPFDIDHWNCETGLRNLESAFSDLKGMTRKEQFDCFGDALLEYKNNGGFGLLPDSEKIFLAVWINDSDRGNWIFDWCNKLNDEETARNFALSNFGPNFFSDAVK